MLQKNEKFYTISMPRHSFLALLYFKRDFSDNLPVQTKKIKYFQRAI